MQSERELHVLAVLSYLGMVDTYILLYIKECVYEVGEGVCGICCVCVCVCGAYGYASKIISLSEGWWAVLQREFTNTPVSNLVL